MSYEESQYWDIMKANAVREYELLAVSKLGLVPFQDGNRWCVLWGSNIQDGISGFGDTPDKAILDFNAAFFRVADKGE